MGKMGDVARAGRTVVLVSHNMGAVRQLCTVCCLIAAGGLKSYKKTNEVIATYIEAQQDLPGGANFDPSGKPARGSRRISLGSAGTALRQFVSRIDCEMLAFQMSIEVGLDAGIRGSENFMEVSLFACSEQGHQQR